MTPLWSALIAAVIVYLIVGPLFDLVVERLPDGEDDDRPPWPPDSDANCKGPDNSGRKRE